MSRWGNFLQGIESGLDKILAEDGPDSKLAVNADRGDRPVSPANNSRQSSGRKRSDRLQDRLAKAVDTSTGEPKRTLKNVEIFVDSNREEINTKEKEEDIVNGEAAQPLLNSRGQEERQDDLRIELEHKFDELNSKVPPDSKTAPDVTATNLESTTSEGRTDENKSESEGLNEVYLLERVEALQTKLDVFIREASERAQAAKSGPKTPDSDKIIMLEKKVANLMAEGQNLSQKELKHLSTIRRLHARVNEANVATNKERKVNSEAERTIHNLKLKMESMEVARREVADDEDRKDLTSQLQESRRLISIQASEISSLRQDLETASSTNLGDSLRRVQQQLDSEKRSHSGLKDDLENSKIERELEVGRLKSQIEAAKKEIVQEREKNAVMQNDFETEIKMLESRLESLRSRNEEVAGGTTDGQAKQLRQIEALQRQYSVSKENWNGIEASLNSRIASLEGERDELLRKEADLRRKLRDSITSARNREEEADDLRSLNMTLEDKLKVEKNSLKELRNALGIAQSDLSKAEAEHDRLKEEVKVAQNLSNARVEALEAELGLTSSHNQDMRDRSTSPFAKRKVLGSVDAKDRKQLAGPGLFSLGVTAFERPVSSRKVSLASPQFPSHSSFRQQSAASLTRSSSRSALQDAPSISADDDLDRADDLATPATPGRAFGDVLSASTSTPAAGPSVQLVERMSSAVRRLESEKAASRDELERMSAERDEARKQIVSLLEEVESKRALESKVFKLEEEVADTAKRYQTTLELLGEKSEQVGELKADIADMKQIYREALEKSLKE